MAGKQIEVLLANVNAKKCSAAAKGWSAGSAEAPAV